MPCSKYRIPDFLAADFLPADFDTKREEIPFIITFKVWLFELLPWYFKSEDTYKDGQGEGLLERYMSVFGSEIDENIIPEILCYLRIIDAQICESQYLVHISNSLGNPPDIFQTEQEYRNLLSYIVSVYKIKGTLESYELFFGILGFNVVINEIEPNALAPLEGVENIYDLDGEELTYDMDDELFIYDQTGCEPCSYYDLDLTAKEGLAFDVDDALMRRIYETISFNEPINAKLRNLVINE